MVKLTIRSQFKTSSGPRLLKLFLLIKLATRIGCRSTPPVYVVTQTPFYIMLPAIPNRFPLSLAVRMIPVYTTDPHEPIVYQAWALPHLNDALCNPELQLFNNFLSYYHDAEKENHLEFPFIDEMWPDSPVPASSYGEPDQQCLHYPGCYAGYLPFLSVTA